MAKKTATAPQPAVAAGPEMREPTQTQALMLPSLMTCV